MRQADGFDYAMLLRHAQSGMKMKANYDCLKSRNLFFPIGTFKHCPIFVSHISLRNAISDNSMQLPAEDMGTSVVTCYADDGYVSINHVSEDVKKKTLRTSLKKILKMHISPTNLF